MVIVALSSSFGLNTVQMIAIMKVLTIAGGLVGALTGILTRDARIRLGSAAVLFGLLLLLIGASFNNLNVIGV